MKETGYVALQTVRSNGFPKCQKVLDGDRHIIVEVTRKHQQKGKILDKNHCALAVACEEATRCDGVIIGFSLSFIINGNTAHRYKNSQTIMREITSFDRKAGFDTGIYRLVPFPPSARLGVPRTPSKTSGGKNGRSTPVTVYHHTRNVRTFRHKGN